MKRRFEVLLPVTLDDYNIPMIAAALIELAAQVGGVSYSPVLNTGLWIEGGTVTVDETLTVYVDMDDTDANRAWFVLFVRFYETAFAQRKLYAVSYPIETL